MGSSQSKSSELVACEKELLERLRATQITRKDDLDDASRRTPQVNEKIGSPEPREPEAISLSEVGLWQNTLLRDPKNRLALSALNNTSITQVVTSPAAQVADQHVFNVQIPFEGGPITNQRSSGRCWLFASTNVFRVALMQKYKLDTFELSQAYLFFWDKLEKANWFLEQVLSTAHLPLDDRLVQTLFQEPLSDGGQWDMVYNLVQKYGLVPQALYPDRYSARNSSGLNSVVFTKLREGALALRRLSSSSAAEEPAARAESISRVKAQIVRDIHTVLTLTLGPPPAADADFEWEFVDRAGRARAVRATPREFAADIASAELPAATAAAVGSMVSLVHDPRHPPLRLLAVDRLGNVVGGRGVAYVNAPLPALKRACVAQLRAGLPVFFGCDVGKSSSSDAGILDTRLIDYGLLFGGSSGRHHHHEADQQQWSAAVVPPLAKADRLRSGESAMTHAMVLTAVHVDQATGDTVRWRVQNSWGESAGDRGWFVMTDAWLDEFVYQAVVDPRFLPREIREVLGDEPIVLPLWDPMGSLA